MQTFKYTAHNAATGQTVKSTVQADNEKAAARLIQDQGLSPLDIVPEQDAQQGRFHRIKTKEKILFARQLSTLINAGLPLVQSLRMVQRQAQSPQMRAVVSKVIADVEAGQAFNKALAQHPTVFGEIFVNLVAAGEASGTLDAALERLANQQEKDAEILAKIRGAMIYPLVVIVVMIAVVTFMLVTVLPQVKVLYDGIGGGVQLPLITRVLLAVSTFIIHFWWLFIIVVIIAFAYSSRWARTAGGKQVIDKMKMRTPPFGALFMKVYMARFCRTGATLVASGVPLLQMLDITGKSIANVYVEDSIQKAITKVKGGKSLADALDGDPNFLELVPNMLRIGEQAGSIEQMLSRTADYYEKEVDQQIKTVNTIIEPMLMIILGVVALVIVGAVLLPIYGLAGQDLTGQ